MQNLTSFSQTSAGNITCSKNFTITGTTTFTGVATFNATPVISSGYGLTLTKGALAVGAFSSATAGSGIALSSSVTKAASVYSDDAGVAMTGSIRGFLSRVLLTVDHAGDLSIRGLMGQLKFKDGVDLTNGVTSGVEGYLEIAGTSNFAATSFTAAVTGVVEVTTATTITSGGYLAGVAAIYNSTATPTGLCSAFITRGSSTGNWPYGLYLTGCARGISFDGVEPPADAGNYGQTLDCTWLSVDPGSGGSFGAKLMFSNTDTSGYVLYGLGLRCRSAAASAKVVGLNVSASAAVASSGQVIGGQFYLQNSGSYTIVGGSGYPSAALYCKSWLTAACDKASALWIDDESTTKPTTQYMVDITMNGSVEIDKVFHIYGGDPGADTFIDFDTCDQGAGAFVSTDTTDGADLTSTHKIKCTVNGSTVGYLHLFSA